MRLTNLGAGMCQQSEAGAGPGLNLRQAVTEDSDKVGKIYREAPILVQPWEKQNLCRVAGVGAEMESMGLIILGRGS